MLKITDDGHLYRWLSRDEKKSHLLLVDIHPDKKQDCVELYVDLVFNAPVVLRGWIKPKSYYIAASGARVSLGADEGEFLGPYTGAATISVKYSGEHAVTQSESVQFKLGAGEEKKNFASVEGGVTAGESRKYAYEFVGSEATLTPQFTPPDAMAWDIAPTRTEKVVSDYAYGNLYLLTHLKLRHGKASVSIEIIPQRVDFYDCTKQRACGLWNNIAMLGRLLLKHGGPRVPGAAGIRANLQITHVKDKHGKN